MYAIIEDSGSQIKVSQGDVIRVAKRDLAEDSATLTFDKVLLIGSEDQTQLGQPLLEGATVTADILEEGRDNKVTIIKFKRRKDYKRKRGHRQDFIKVKITSISG